MTAQMRLYLVVALGGMLGSVSRTLVSLALLQAMGPGFPFGTLAVNVAGSFLIGLYATVTEPGGRVAASPTARQFVLAGFCGGFTTFSIFSLETVQAAMLGAVPLAAFNLVASVLLWLTGVWLGYRAGLFLNRSQG